MNNDSAVTVVGGLGYLIILADLALGATVIAVIWHFVAKMW
jgi:hypothetical protein